MCVYIYIYIYIKYSVHCGLQIYTHCYFILSLGKYQAATTSNSDSKIWSNGTLTLRLLMSYIYIYIYIYI